MFRLLLAAALVLAACMPPAPSVQQAGAPASLAALAGRYTLRTIDGNPIPVSPVHPGAPANARAPEVLASTLVLREDGTFIMAMSYREPTSGGHRFFDMPFSGTWAPDGAGYRMRWDGAGQTGVTIRGDTLVLDNERIIFLYRRVR